MAVIAGSAISVSRRLVSMRKCPVCGCGGCNIVKSGSNYYCLRCSYGWGGSDG